jgi:hypothetical protein
LVCEVSVNSGDDQVTTLSGAQAIDHVIVEFEARRRPGTRARHERAEAELDAADADDDRCEHQRQPASPPHVGYAESSSSLFFAAFPTLVRGCFFARCASTSSAIARPAALVSASAKPVA